MNALGAWVAAVLHAAVLSAADVETMDTVLMRVVHHQQGWGELGINEAAHVPGSTAEPLRIGDTSFERGLGTHAPSETVVLLDGEFTRFHSQCGVHAHGDDIGTVVFQVFADGEQVFDSGVMRETTPPTVIDLDVAGVRELRLVTDDAGDGITWDMAHWINPVLVPDPDATVRPESGGVNMAPFARVLAWDPARMEGTQASRIEPIPAEDLFPYKHAAVDRDGAYEVPVFGDGRACIGLEWLERRRLRKLVLTFDAAPQDLAGATIQYWLMSRKGGSPGGSAWQGNWERLPGESQLDGNRWVHVPHRSAAPDLRTGTLKVRWVFPPDAGPVRVRQFEAYTLTRWEHTDVILEAREGAFGQVSVEIYNGEMRSHGESEPARQHSWDSGAGSRSLSLRYAPPESWQLSDRTVLRFTASETAFGVAVDDVVEHGAVYVEHAGILVSLKESSETIARYQATMAEREGTILGQTRERPDQTSRQAMEHVHRHQGDNGPTMLSLATDNRKFIVERNGVIQFDRRPEVYEHVERQYPGRYAFSLTPVAGNGPPHYMGRRWQGGWTPIPITTLAVDGAIYQQRTFVAPFGPEDGNESTAPWLGSRPLCVAEFTMRNPGGEPVEAALRLEFEADGPAGVTVEQGRVVVRKNGSLIAVITVPHHAGFVVEPGGSAIRIAGVLPAHGEERCVVFLPHWEDAALGEFTNPPCPEALAQDTEAYWRNVMRNAMQIETPDPFIGDLIRASQVHCLLAARNDGGIQMAPWIASILYGPLESEGHSIIRGMMATGHLDFARRALEFYIARYASEGYLTTGYTVMGTGWHLWTLGEYYRLTQDADWLRTHAADIARACQWIMDERRKTMQHDARGEKMPEYGLMPPGVGADWEKYAYYFYLNGYYAAGLREAGAALADIGWDGAEAIVADAAAYETEIRRAYAHVQAQAPVYPLKNGAWVPAYPSQVHAPCPIEQLYPGEDIGRSWCYDVELGAHHLVPFGILQADSEQADWIINHMEDVQFLRSGWMYYPAEKNEADWFNLGGFAKVQPYYARTGEIHALRDDVKPFIRTYFNSLWSLVNREDRSLWEHFFNGAYNKTHETGYFLHDSRLMFVQERGNELWLAPFVTNNWLRNGMHVAVSQAPTRFGMAAYRITSHAEAGYIVAEITPPRERMPDRIVIRLRHPEGHTMREARVEGAIDFAIDPTDSTVHITPSSDRITVRAVFAADLPSVP
jgi:hypothetical protein